MRDQRGATEGPQLFLMSFVVTSIVLCCVIVLSQLSLPPPDIKEDGLAKIATAINRLAKRVPAKGEAACARKDGCLAPTLFGFRKGVVFAIGYSDEGSLAEAGQGICPDESQMRWLQEFRQAIARCAKGKNRPLKLSVRGYASIAPVTRPNGAAERSDEDNLEIANRRGMVIASFLASDNGEIPPALCKAKAKPFECGGDKTADGDCRLDDHVVRHRLWPNYLTMKHFSPVHDGGIPDPRLYQVEFLNRAVHIVVENNACWQRAFPA